MLPKVVLRRSEIASLEKKSFTLPKVNNEKYIVNSFTQLSFEEMRHEELKVQNITLNRI